MDHTDRAALFVDGRYTLQAQQQASSSFWEHRHITNDTPEAWLVQQIKPNDQVGFDPRLHTPDGIGRIAAAVQRAGAKIQPVERNPIDESWQDRPGPPMGTVELFPDSRAGESTAQKRNRIAEVLRKEQMDALVISAPDSVAWLFNIRGAETGLRRETHQAGNALRKPDSLCHRRCQSNLQTADEKATAA